MRPYRPMRPGFWTEWTQWTIWMLPRIRKRSDAARIGAGFCSADTRIVFRCVFGSTATRRPGTRNAWTRSSASTARAQDGQADVTPAAFRVMVKQQMPLSTTPCHPDRGGGGALEADDASPQPCGLGTSAVRTSTRYETARPGCARVRAAGVTRGRNLASTPGFGTPKQAFAEPLAAPVRAAGGPM